MKVRTAGRSLPGGPSTAGRLVVAADRPATLHGILADRKVNGPDRARLLHAPGVVTITTWLLLITQNVGLSTVLFEVVSAFSTTGLSLGLTTQLDTFGRLLIIALMFWGRLGAITIMLILLQRGPRERLIQYPEETVLVG